MSQTDVLCVLFNAYVYYFMIILFILIKYDLHCIKPSVKKVHCLFEVKWSEVIEAQCLCYFAVGKLCHLSGSLSKDCGYCGEIKFDWIMASGEPGSFNVSLLIFKKNVLLIRNLGILNLFALPLCGRCGEKEEPCVWVYHTPGRLRGRCPPQTWGELDVSNPQKT